MTLQNVTVNQVTRPAISEDVILQQHLCDLRCSVMVFSFNDP